MELDGLQIVDELRMSSHWGEVILGIALIFLGIYSTHVRGGITGKGTAAPAPPRVRVILICFGLLFLGIGVYGLIKG